jgi:hypothetical protein
MKKTIIAIAATITALILLVLSLDIKTYADLRTQEEFNILTILNAGKLPKDDFSQRGPVFILVSSKSFVWGNRKTSVLGKAYYATKTTFKERELKNESQTNFIEEYVCNLNAKIQSNDTKP